ncbi:type II secretion system protein [Chitinispirillales bacterium ANBcel5]|uniref:pilus assembly FimT family protein n=1 Tax=Cellulosispirillum alkaliphilum TaxID=3039283 RepID=UPI002A53D2DE|nr:type II secretion system protein [Chitinispirillales bacterium ANBcel5]
MKTNPPDRNGFTIVELMVSVFILGIISTSLLQGLYSGDKIRGRANVARSASHLALNEAERIKNSATTGFIIQDSVYQQTIRGVSYSVNRTVLSHHLTDNSEPIEIHIDITPEPSDFPSYSFRMIQGYDF